VPVVTKRDLKTSPFGASQSPLRRLRRTAPGGGLANGPGYARATPRRCRLSRPTASARGDQHASDPRSGTGRPSDMPRCSAGTRCRDHLKRCMRCTPAKSRVERALRCNEQRVLRCKTRFATLCNARGFPRAPGSSRSTNPLEPGATRKGTWEGATWEQAQTSQTPLCSAALARGPAFADTAGGFPRIVTPQATEAERETPPWTFVLSWLGCREGGRFDMQSPVKSVSAASLSAETRQRHSSGGGFGRPPFLFCVVLFRSRTDI
jgi:hypothetical protein